MNYEPIIREFWESHKKSTCIGALDIELVSIDAERVVLRMPISDKVRQPMGLFHGGMSMVLAETCGSLHASWGVNPRDKVPVGIEINGSHLSAASDGHVVATGRVVKRGRKIIVHEVEIVHEDSGKVMNVSRITNMYLERNGTSGSHTST